MALWSNVRFRFGIFDKEFLLGNFGVDVIEEAGFALFVPSLGEDEEGKAFCADWPCRFQR